MKRKIIPIAFWISLVLEFIDFLDRIKIKEVLKMLDIRVILEIGIAIIFISSSVIYISEKYKKFNKRLSMLEKRFATRIKITEARRLLNELSKEGIE